MVKKMTKKIQNILFTSTKQWNIGDEFIYLGIKNLFNDMGIKYNPILFNRNPQITKGFDFLNIFKKKNFLKHNFEKNIINSLIYSFFDIVHLDNSINFTHLCEKWIDKIIFAGTPEWFSLRMKNLYEYAIEYSIPYYFIGIGIHPHTYTLLNSKILNFKEIIRNASLIITRNKNEGFDVLKKFNNNVYYIGCPALFCSKDEKKEFEFDKEFLKIGIVFSFPESPHGHKITFETFKYILQLIKNLSRFKDIQINYIFHYIDDIFYICCKYQKLMNYLSSDGNIYYSHDVYDYFTIYKNMDLIISTRVHGNGIASSLGIPNMHIPHDERADTVRGFGSYVSYKNLDKDIQLISRLISSLNEEHSKLINFKYEQKKKFIDILQETLD